MTGMTGLSIVVIIVGVGIVVFVLVEFVLLLGRMKQVTQTGQALLVLQKEIDSLRGQISQDFSALNLQVSERLHQNLTMLDTTNRNMGERLDNAQRVISDVQRSLGEVKESNQKIYEVGKDIAGLQDILRAPKFRGGLGELMLGDLLIQILPTQFFELQHKFRSGEIVDAVIKLANGWVPVDAKFPLENFQKLIQIKNEDEYKTQKKRFVRDVQKHIDDIATKYILTDEGTFDFALMYIPAENVYYETIIKDEALGEDTSLLAYGLKKHVIPVSPNSFYAYLEAIVLGLRGFQIEKNVHDILNKLTRLQSDFGRFKEDFMLMGKHLSNAYKTFEDAQRRLDRFNEKLIAVEELTPLSKESD